MKVDLKVAFANTLQDLRRKSKLSQQELADYAELDRSSISKIERGIQSPTLETIFKLAAVLKVRPNEWIQQIEKITK